MLRISMAVQEGNSVCVVDSIPAVKCWENIISLWIFAGFCEIYLKLNKYNTI